MNFSSIEQIQNKQGTIFKVRNPKDCKNFYWLKNQKVIIDGTQYVVIDVKRQRFRRTHKKGEMIGLLVRPIDKK
jgi:hypothetical protein